VGLLTEGRVSNPTWRSDRYAFRFKHLNPRVPRFDKRRTIQRGQVGNLSLRIAAISK